MELKELLEKLKICLAKSYEGNGFKDMIQLIAQFYIKQFDLKEDEISILLTDKDKFILSFAYPEYLVDCGMIPLNSPDAYAAFLFKLGKGMMDNNFNQQKHLHLFETIPTPDKKIKFIWKIMGVALRDGENKFGVMEISRKGEEYANSGPDFTSENLTLLERSITQIAPILLKIIPPDFRGKIT